MSLRSRKAQDAGAPSSEIHHPAPTRPPALQWQVTIATETIQQHLTWPHRAPVTNAPKNEKSEQNVEVRPATKATTNTLRSPSTPAVMSNAPTPPTTSIHSILTVPSALRASLSPRMRFTWDIRFSPDAPPVPVALGRRDDNTPNTCSIRPRSNTHPTGSRLSPDLTPASNTRTCLSLDKNSHPEPAEGGTGQAFTSHPIASEPATFPPRERMVIIYRDLLSWLIPVDAHDPEVGCTVLDVVQGIYAALQVKVEITGHARSASDGTRTNRERRRVEWLRDKTMFVCLGRDEALARRRLPGCTSLWEETFVLTLARRRE